MGDTFLSWSEKLMIIKESEGIGHSQLECIRLSLRHLSELNSRPIESIDYFDIQMIINNIHLSRRTLTLIKTTAVSVFELAINCRAIDFNPAKMVKIPKSAPQTTRKGLSHTQQQWIVDTPHRAQAPAMVMLFAGLRRGEVTALRWDDIDFTNNIIKVDKAVEFVNNQPVVKPPKTEAGCRTIWIPNILSNYLKSAKAKSKSEYIICAFDNPDKMLSKQGWRVLWRSYMNDLNVKYGNGNKHSPYNRIVIETFTPHQLRHTYASILYEADVDVLTARDFLGHSNVQTTLQIYTHLSERHYKNQSEKLDNFLLNTF